MPTLSSEVDRACALARTDPTAAVVALGALRRAYPRNPRPGKALKGLAQQYLDDILPQANARARAGDWSGALAIIAPLASVEMTNPRLTALAAEGFCAISRPGAALDLLSKARKNRPHDATLAALEGQALKASAQPDEAERALREALKLEPGHDVAGSQLGLSLLEHGDTDAAVTGWRRVVAHNPYAGDTWLNLASHIDFAAEPELLKVLDGALSTPGLSTQQQECLAFARADAAFDMHDGDTAFTHLNRANAMRRRALGYRPETDKRLFEEIKRRFGSVRSSDRTPSSDQRAVLITGLPRSGTALTEQILAAHPDVCAGGEMDALNAAMRPHLAPDAPGGDLALQAIADDYRAAVSVEAGTSRVLTDKMALNFRWIGPALAAMPELRVIHVTRDPMATGFSLYRHRFSGNGNAFCYGLEDIAAYQSLTEDLMAYWRTIWGAQILDIRYEDLMDDLEVSISKIISFSGLEWSPECVQLHKLRRGMQSTQIRSRDCSDRAEEWRSYSKYLHQLK